MMRNGVVHVQLHGNLLAFAVFPATFAVALVEVAEHGHPAFCSVRPATDQSYGLAYHGVGFLLVVPSVFNP